MGDDGTTVLQETTHGFKSACTYRKPMRWTLACVPVTFLLLALAGCAGQAPAETPDDFALDGDLEATATTGVIRGVVVDEAVVPVAGATVAIAALGRETTVDEGGAFGFGAVEPGNHFLTVAKLGYQTQQASVVVEAGVDQPPVLRVQLVRDPATTPYVTAYQFTGFMKCSLSYIALCGVAPDETGDSFLAEFEVTAPPAWVNMEAVWEGTQPTGDQMNLNMGATPAGPDTTCCTAQGPSPLLAQANKTVLAEYGVGAGENLIGRMFAWEMEGTGIDDHTGQCVPVVLTTYCQGPGAAIDQEFELFVHAFFHYAPPEDWRFTSDPDVPRPS